MNKLEGAAAVEFMFSRGQSVTVSDSFDGSQLLIVSRLLHGVKT
jgi:hypothetical protein